jgi:hypothetical protein
MTSSLNDTQGFVPNDDSNPQQGAVYHQQQRQDYPSSKSQRSTASPNANRSISRDDRKLFVGGLPSNSKFLKVYRSIIVKRNLSPHYYT